MNREHLFLPVSGHLSYISVDPLLW